MLFLDINDFMKSDEPVLAFDFAVDLSQLDDAFSAVSISGKIKNVAGEFRFSATVQGQYATVCDRCLDPVLLDLTAVLDTVIAPERSEDDSVIVTDGRIDLCRTIYDALVLSLPSKILCCPDCRGLCSMCGRNLNDENCECFHGTADSPLVVSE